MTAPQEVQDERNAEWWEPKPFEFTMPDEPEELTRFAEAVKAEREYQDARCADCGERRAAHFGSSGHIVGIDHDFVELCPNVDDPVHDREELADVCVCGHIRGGHHRLCNGKVGKFWCHCRTFEAAP